MGIYINIGNAGFQSARNGEYVDKSGLISVVNKTLFTKRRFSCVSRCRRFGKSMAAKMLYAYYDHSCDSRSLFADLQIASDPTFEQHLESSRWEHVSKALEQSRQLLQDTLDGDEEAVARGGRSLRQPLARRHQLRPRDQAAHLPHRVLRALIS